MASQPSNTSTAPDPDEEDLDDLDDVLDEFESKPKLPTQSKPTDSGPGGPEPDSIAAAATSESAVEDDTDLSTQLQDGMASLISELGENPEMQKQFEDMMQELIAAGAAPTADQAAEHVKRASENAPKDPSEEVKAIAGGAKAGSDNFQDTVRKTMERMQQSSTSATAASASSENKSEEELLAEMMKSLGAGDAGAGGEEDFNKMLMSMMTQLTNKEILYEPMKELDEKFPAWMEKNAEGAKKEDLERYRRQQALVREIVERFDRKEYSDENEGDREYIVERMQKMQAEGSPPPDLVGDMSAAQEALGDLDAGCPTQ